MMMMMNSVLLFLILQLNRATVQNSVTGQLETASYRVSKRWVHMSIPFHVALWYERSTRGSILVHWYDSMWQIVFYQAQLMQLV